MALHESSPLTNFRDSVSCLSGRKEAALTQLSWLPEKAFAHSREFPRGNFEALLRVLRPDRPSQESSSFGNSSNHVGKLVQ